MVRQLRYLRSSPKTSDGSQYFQPSNKTLDSNNPTFGIQLNNRVVAGISIDAWSARAEAQFKVMGYGRSIQAQPAPYPTWSRREYR